MDDRSSLPTEMINDRGSDLQRRSRLLNILATSGIVTCVLFLSIMLLTPLGAWPYILIFALLLSVCIASVVLNRMGYFSLASLLFLVSVSLAIAGIVVIGAGRQRVISPVIFYYPFTVLAAGMVFGSRATYAFATLNVLCIIAIGFLAAFFEVPITDVWGTPVPAAVLCYLMALIAWLYGNSLEGAVRQLTERSQELQNANEEIREFSRTLEDKVKERTQELQEFVSMVTHDLRAPLTAVKGYVEMLQERQSDQSDPIQERAWNTIAASIQQMVHLTDDLLEITRLQSGGQLDMESVPIEGVIRDACVGFEPQVTEKRLGLKVDLPPELPRVWVDQLRLTQVLNNLIGNAYNYTPSGAIIVSARPLDGFVEVSISDTGIGIPREEQKRLFSHFFRGAHKVVRGQRGSGLGLAISRSIIKAHGGEIWVESEEGKGSTFRFTLPLAADQPNKLSPGALQSH